MTTSSDHRKPELPTPSGEHWLSLTATLSKESTDEFGDWLSENLHDLEALLEVFVTAKSRQNARRH